MKTSTKRRLRIEKGESVPNESSNRCSLSRFCTVVYLNVVFSLVFHFILFHFTAFLNLVLIVCAC